MAGESTSDPYWGMHVPFKDTTLNLGSGPPSNGVGLTTGEGDIFTFAQGTTGIDSVGAIWVQSNADAGVVADTGVTLGSNAGILGTAGGDVNLWAGAAMGANVGTPNGPAGPPTPPTAPCANTEAAVNRANALNGMIKGGADVVTGIQDGGAGGAWDALKGAWDVAKGANDYQGGTMMDPGTVKTIDTITKVGDGVKALAEGDLLGAGSTLAALGGGSLLGEIAGIQGADAGGGGAAGGAGGQGGGGKIIAKAPGNIEKTTDSDMTAIVAGKIEYKAGKDIVMNAANKVETLSLFFEAHANVKAVMKGLAIAKVESVGATTVEGRAKFAVKTNAKGEIKSGGTLDIESTGPMSIKGKAGIKVNGGPKVHVHTTKFSMNATGDAQIQSPMTKVCGKMEITKDAFAKAEMKAKTLKILKGSTLDGTLLVKKKVTCKSMCEFG